ncbi:MAG TPA: PDZ domain-containing protein [Candidatus Aminicenantes bacterium]|nr:PDZ domain-containing protein [Candidatus Aminicenantes bacterium]
MIETIPPLRRACLPAFAILLCLGPPALFGQEQTPQPEIWPSRQSGQWVWVAPRTDLSPAGVEAAFARMINEATAYVESRTSGVVFLPRKFRLTEGSAKKRRLYKERPEKAGDLRFTCEWQSGYLNQDRGQTYAYIPLDAVRGIDLHYMPRMRERFAKAPEGRNWVVNVFADTRYSFFFSLEDTARLFISALASTLEQRGLKLSFSRTGLMWENITLAQAADMGRAAEGVLVTRVAAGSPADRAGVRPLDVVLEVNGEKVKNYSHLALLLDGLAPGTRAAFKLLRRLKPPDALPGPCPWEPLSVEMEAR